VQAAQRAVQAQQALRRGAVDFSKTTLNGSVGQYNTYRVDNQFSIVQPLALPGVYRNAARVAGQLLTGRELQLAQARVELRRQVRLAYEQAVYARHRLRTLRGQDSLYAEFLRAANLRFKTGEVARLEPATALVQQGETRVLVRQARTDYTVARRQLQALLQQAGPVTIADSVLRPLVPLAAAALVDTATAAVPALADTILLQTNPQARVLAQQIQERRAETRLEQARGLPDFTVGYFNQSLKGPQTIGGVGGPERDYGSADRFQGVQASVGMPLYRRPQKARVQAARLQEQTAEISYARYRAELAGRLDELLAQRREQIERLRFYEQTGLPQAAVLVRLSTRAFKAGETGYAEYLLNLERALRLRTDYLAALLAHNQTVIELDALIAGDAQ
jgi:cobalt-zinc-cadmium resistance protein CzcA